MNVKADCKVLEAQHLRGHSIGKLGLILQHAPMPGGVVVVHFNFSFPLVHFQEELFLLTPVIPVVIFEELHQEFDDLALAEELLCAH